MRRTNQAKRRNQAKGTKQRQRKVREPAVAAVCGSECATGIFRVGAEDAITAEKRTLEED